MKYLFICLALIGCKYTRNEGISITANCAMYGMNYVFHLKDYTIEGDYYDSITDQGKRLLLPIDRCLIMESKEDGK